MEAKRLHWIKPLQRVSLLMINDCPTKTDPNQIVELSELDLESISAGNWFEKMTGISIKSIDKVPTVPAAISNSWLGALLRISRSKP